MTQKTIPGLSRKSERRLDLVLAQLGELEALARDPEDFAQRAPAVSKWSVGQQLEHLAAVDDAVLRGLEKGARGELTGPGGRPNLMGRVLLLAGRIPRGRGRAPENVHPQGLDAAAVAEALADRRHRYAELAPDLGRLEAERTTFPHPVFGHLDVPTWLRFADVHHRHHRRIIDDILRAAKR